MKQIVILSGKGGTGKTSLAGAFIHLASVQAPRMETVIADADVDAANLELILAPKHLESHDFSGSLLAHIDPQECTSCDVCRQVCRFDAILPGETYQVDAIACEGCAACMYQCPEEAIHMQGQIAGQWHRSESHFGPLLHADLRPAQENSGKLVTMVKQQARLVALDTASPLLIVDGPPGIGCPVISSLSGADLALIVAEPTASGIHDMQRILDTAAHFNLSAVVCINKADLYPQGTRLIAEYCQEQNLEIIGSIPFDEAVTHAMMKGQPVTIAHPKSPASQAIRSIWGKLLERVWKN